MNRRQFLKGSLLGLFACVVPSIVKENKLLVMGVDIAKKEESKTIVATTTPKGGWLGEYFPQKEKLVIPTSNKKRKALAQIIKDAECELNFRYVTSCDLQGDIIAKDAWSKWMEGVTLYHFTEEKDGMFYELARSPLHPNPDSDNKFDGINHLIDKENNDV